jgi:hypothetical protein
MIGVQPRMPSRSDAAEKYPNQGGAYTPIINQSHAAHQTKVIIDLIVVIPWHSQRIFNMHSLNVRLDKNGVSFHEAEFSLFEVQEKHPQQFVVLYHGDSVPLRQLRSFCAHARYHFYSSSSSALR